MRTELEKLVVENNAASGAGKGNSAECIDLIKSYVEITVENKGQVISEESSDSNISAFPMFLRGSDITFSFRLIFEKILPKGSAIFFFSSQIKNTAPKNKKKRNLSAIVRKILGIFRIKREDRKKRLTGEIDISKEFSKLKPLENKARSQGKDGTIGVASRTEAVTTQQEETKQFNIRPFLAFFSSKDIREHEFSVVMDSTCFNIVAPKAGTMWLTIHPAKKGSVNRLGLSLPDVCTAKMVFLVASPSYISIELAAEQNLKTVTRSVRFFRNDGKPVKIFPDFDKKELNAVSVGQDSDSEYTVGFDLKKFEELARTEQDEKVYRKLRFRDRLSNDRLSVVLPVSVCRLLLERAT